MTRAVKYILPCVLIATILNVFEAAGAFDNDIEFECDEDVCIGAIIK